MKQLGGFVHWIQTDDDSPGAQRPIVGDCELRRVLQEQRNSVSRLYSSLEQPTCEAAYRGVEVAKAQLTSVEDQRRPVRNPLRLCREQRAQWLIRKMDRRLIHTRWPMLGPSLFHVRLDRSRWA